MPSIEDLLRIGGRPLDKAKQGAVSWFKQAVRNIRKDDDPSKSEDKSRTGFITKGPELQGQMVAFSYDPKLKKTLPYYDRYPLVIPLSLDASGMLGLNLHYLPPRVRLSFVRALQQLATETNGQKKLRISYSLLKAAKGLGLYAPCLKRYLHGHVRSRIIQVDSRDWEKATLLPLARFVGASESQVWSDSMSGRKAKLKTTEARSSSRRERSLKARELRQSRVQS